jgi:hypothetical protein
LVTTSSSGAMQIPTRPAREQGGLFLRLNHSIALEPGDFAP